jgi:hypothetical protein
MQPRLTACHLLRLRLQFARLVHGLLAKVGYKGGAAHGTAAAPGAAPAAAAAAAH